MTNFTYAVETNFQSYLQNSVTASMTYPILRGHTNEYNEPQDYPIIGVMCENYEEEIPFSGVMKANMVIEIISNAHDSQSYEAHGLACSEVYRVMADQNGIQNWINNPSSSLYIAGVPSNGTSCGFQGNNFSEAMKYVLLCQQMEPSSSTSTYGQ